ncbi:MAG: DUF2723 domain-containing protein, partial [bacterium]
MTRAFGALLFLSVAWIYIRGQAPDISVDSGDTSELVASALTLSNPHPPGYPLHALLGRLAASLPVGGPAFRVGLVSTVAGALTALGAGVLAGGAAMALGIPGTGAGLLAALAWACSPAFWWLTAIGEKYPLAMAGAAGGVAALWAHARDGRPRSLLGAALLAGIALDCHLMGAFLLPVLAASLWRIPDRRRTAILAVAWLLLALSLKPLYAGIRAAADPLINWETPDRVGRLLSYLLVLRYGDRFYGLSAAGEIGARVLSHVMRFPWHELGLLLLASLPGWWSMKRGPAGTRLGAVLLVGASIAIASVYRMYFIVAYYLPVIWILA